MGHRRIVAQNQTGYVRWFNSGRGYGWIVPSNGADDVFVHIRDVEYAGWATLRRNIRLKFDLRKDGRKLSAANLRFEN